MNRSKQISAIAASCLMVLGFAASAQDEGRDACVEACREQNADCVSACGAHGDPIECEERCDDAVEDCIRNCD